MSELLPVTVQKCNILLHLLGWGYHPYKSIYRQQYSPKYSIRKYGFCGKKKKKNPFFIMCNATVVWVQIYSPCDVSDFLYCQNSSDSCTSYYSELDVELCPWGRAKLISSILIHYPNWYCLTGGCPPFPGLWNTCKGQDWAVGGLWMEGGETKLPANSSHR